MAHKLRAPASHPKFSFKPHQGAHKHPEALWRQLQDVWLLPASVGLTNMAQTHTGTCINKTRINLLKKHFNMVCFTVPGIHSSLYTFIYLLLYLSISSRVEKEKAFTRNRKTYAILQNNLHHQSFIFLYFLHLYITYVTEPTFTTSIGITWLQIWQEPRRAKERCQGWTWHSERDSLPCPGLGGRSRTKAVIYSASSMCLCYWPPAPTFKLGLTAVYRYLGQQGSPPEWATFHNGKKGRERKAEHGVRLPVWGIECSGSEPSTKH